MSFDRPNAIVAQSGGPTAAINATLAGVISGLCSDKRIGTAYGAKNGIVGVLNDNLIGLNYLFEDKGKLDELAKAPGCALGSCRHKLPESVDDEVYQKIFDVFHKYNVKYFFYIGGNDSMDTVAKLSLYNDKIGGELNIMGLPKTIDNDLVLTDHTPGYGSAAKYVASVVYEIAMDVCAYRMPSVTFVEVMGRDAGWLNCASALSGYYHGVGADLVYIPEMEVTLEKMLSQIKELLSLKRGITVAISEGIRVVDRQGEKDAFNHLQNAGIGGILANKVKEAFGCKTRSVELNLPQRCAGHILSKTDVTESFGVGEYGAFAALSGFSGKMVSIERRSGEYGVEFNLVDASQVANKVKTVPRDFFDKPGFVNQKCIDYVSPLVMGEVELDYSHGIPKYFRIV